MIRPIPDLPKVDVRLAFPHPPRVPRLLCFCLLALMLGGCATRSQIACPAAAPGRAAQVFFATDRMRADRDGRLGFGPARTEPPALRVGWEEVAISTLR